MAQADQPQVKKPSSDSFHFEKPKDWLKAHSSDSDSYTILLQINRTDSAHFTQMDSVLVPNDPNGDVRFYMPFPMDVPYLDSIHKIIFFSYPAEAFGAYANGHLVYAGATNMGRKKDPTPIGFFFTNWKAVETTSTSNDEWDLHWNFNIDNKNGIGFHQYDLPGYPASHSCLRLSWKDAANLYNWADQWITLGKDSILITGTPVIIFGNYVFGSPKPWLQLTQNPHSLDISEDEIKSLTMSHIDSIMLEQRKRDDQQKK